MSVSWPVALQTEYPLADLVQRVFSRSFPLQKGEVSGYNRSLYLELAEPVVRTSLEWQQPSGALIDPYEGAEPPTIAARFVGAAAGLISAGKCADILPQFIQGYDYAAQQLHDMSKDKKLHGVDFYIKELAWAYCLVQKYVGEQDLARWRSLLGRYDPEEIYEDVVRSEKTVVNNFNIYALTGEYWRYRCKIGSGDISLPFVNKYIPLQLEHFTPYGMYRDPNNPITYDLTVRQNLSLLLHAGYEDVYRPILDELLRRGALTTLFFVAPDGQAPFGGRSNQFHHMEGMIACISEFEASRYARKGEMALAGAFKRLAHEAVASSIRWWRQKPWRDLKNSFHPITRHGRDGYGEYSVYSLLAASLYGVAYHLADDAIPEAPLPGEIVGYTLDLTDSFHKVFASAGGYHIEIDTQADLVHDATGLGRLAHPLFPMELSLSMPLCGNPKYSTVPAELQHAAIGPVWHEPANGMWVSLAAQNQAAAQFDVEVEQPDYVRFRVGWEGVSNGEGNICQVYELSPAGLVVKCQFDFHDNRKVGFEVPLLLSDGDKIYSVRHSEREFSVTGESGVYLIACRYPSTDVRLYFRGEAPGKRRLQRAVNRNGVYRIGVFELAPDEREITLSFTLGTT